MAINKQKKLAELHELKLQHEKKIEQLQEVIQCIYSPERIRSTNILEYIKPGRVINSINSLQSEIKKYNILLTNVEKEIKKIESMSETEAKMYIVKDLILDGLSKLSDIISEMMPRHVTGRIYQVSDNWFKYWMIFIAFGWVVILILRWAGVLELG